MINPIWKRSRAEFYMLDDMLSLSNPKIRVLEEWIELDGKVHRIQYLPSGKLLSVQRSPFKGDGLPFNPVPLKHEFLENPRYWANTGAGVKLTPWYR